MGDNETLLQAGGLQASHVRMPEAEASRLAASLWSVPGTARRLATEKDDTFLLRGREGTGFVLKVSNPVERPIELDFEVALHRHVFESGRGVRVPELFPVGGRPIPGPGPRRGRPGPLRPADVLRGGHPT